jgi:hypothetical protein
MDVWENKAVQMQETYLLLGTTKYSRKPDNNNHNCPRETFKQKKKNNSVPTFYASQQNQ